MHLAECRAIAEKEEGKVGALLLTNGKRERVWFEDINIDDSDFEVMGEAFNKETGAAPSGIVGLARALLMPQRELSIIW